MATNDLPFRHATESDPAKVFLIAEIGVNHDGSVDKALALINAARAAGADAVKFQYFNPRRLLSNQAKLAKYQEGEADPFLMLDRLRLNIDEMIDCREEAEVEDLLFIVTPFSIEDITDLKEIAPDMLKIASPDAVNTPLLEAATELDKPMLISTGTCAMKELEPATKLLKAHGPGGGLLQCVSSYPTPIDGTALGGIASMRARFDLPVGYSDHTQETVTGALAVTAGATILEKHFTFNREAEGPDHAASLDPILFTHYCDLARMAARMLGPLTKQAQPIESDVRDVSRQSVCLKENRPAGHQLRPEDLTVRRPGHGIPAAKLNETVGRTLANDRLAGDILCEDDCRD